MLENDNGPPSPPPPTEAATAAGRDLLAELITDCATLDAAHLARGKAVTDAIAQLATAARSKTRPTRQNVEGSS